MSEQVEERLAELRREYELGQRRLQELMGQEVALRETLLRISGAIQVLEELSGTPAGAPAPPHVDGVPVQPPAPGSTLTVG
jgi:hypothetical protein